MTWSCMIWYRLRLAAQNGLRVVICGGDGTEQISNHNQPVVLGHVHGDGDIGTINWVLSAINALHLPKQPPVYHTYYHALYCMP